MLFLEALLKRVRAIPRRVWMAVAALIATLGALLIFGAVAVVWTLWTQVPAASEAGRRLLDRAATQVERLAPAVTEQADRWRPGVASQLDRLTENWVPPEADVSGADVGPVTRYPGLFRTGFARWEAEITSRYSGRVPFSEVLAHYVAGFAAAGYRHEVLTATTEHEHHRFAAVDDVEVFELSLQERGGLVDVTLTQRSKRSN